VKVVLISTYELGRQPFGLASPAAWLRAEGFDVACLDLSQQPLKDNEGVVRSADFIALYLPMHTATRLGLEVLRRVRELNPAARLAAYGLYAPLNAALLQGLGVSAIIGGEFEAALVAAAKKGASETHIALDRLQFRTPDRRDLPPLKKYARLVMPNGRERIVGYTEASRGCKHLCRHCPIVPVYNGAFRVVQRDVVLADIRQQVAAGAEHITFGDPDFFNGPAHALEIVRALQREFPQLTYDVTIKVEHLLKHAGLLPELRDTGCAFVTTAVESVDDRVLDILDKGHTRADFYRLVELCRSIGLTLQPTFVAFTPWTSLAGYAELLAAIAELELVESVAPVQLALRLLVPAGSRLLERPEMQAVLGEFDARMLSYRWQHSDPRVDALQREVERTIQRMEKNDCSRREIFARVCELAAEAGEEARRAIPDVPPAPTRATIPYLTEPWYC
jgi:radical SAM superfamily enzyme YgiQ (UPF0313 family)